MFRQLFLSCVFLALMPVSISQANAAENRIPLKDFVLEDQYSTPKLSPDGKYLAVTMRIAEKDRFVPTIAVFSLPDMKQQGAVQMPVREVPNQYYWVSNTRLLVTKAIEVGALEQPQLTGEVFAMDFNGENQVYLYGRNMHLTRNAGRYGDNYGTGVVHSVPVVKTGHFNLSTSLWDSEKTMLYDMDSKNGVRKLTTSISVRGAQFVLQNNGKPRFANAGNKDGEQVLYRYDEEKDDWILVDKKETGGYLIPMVFNADDTAFYAMFREGNEPYYLIKQDVKTGQRVTIAQDKKGEFNLSQSSAQSDIPFVLGTDYDLPRLQYLDPKSDEAKLHQLLSSKFPNNYVEFLNFTDDGKRLLFSVSSDREPGAYFIFDRASGRAYPLFAARQAIDPDQMSERRPIHVTARDGVELDGYLTVPKDANPAKKMPMVVIAHGGPHGPYDHWFYDTDAQFLASRGYSVLQINFRGSGGRGEGFIRSGYRKWGSDIQNDLIDGVRWAIKEANVDANRICTYGGSFGGYSALMMPVREPDMFKCAVGYAGVYDLNLLFTSEESKQRSFKTVMTKYVGNDSTELDKFSPSKFADKIHIPVMLVHGIEDTRATFNHAEAMRAALIKAHRPPEWMAVENEGHGFYKTENRIKFYENLEAFLAKYLRE